MLGVPEMLGISGKDTAVTGPMPGAVGGALGAAYGLAGQLVSPLAGVPAALSVPLCERPPSMRVLRSGLGVLESAIVDPRGRLFVSSQFWDGLAGAVLRMDHPDAEPVKLAGGIDAPGGLAFDDRGMLIAGFGASVHGGLIGNLAGRAGLPLIDPDSGQQRTYVTGLEQANGVARAPDGTTFASNDFGTHIDRIDPDGTVHRRWARVRSANSLAVDPGGRYLYAAQTWAAAAIKRVEIANPANVTTYARPGPPAWAAGLDSLAIDATGRLYVAADGAGQIWQVEPGRTITASPAASDTPATLPSGTAPAASARATCMPSPSAATSSSSPAEHASPAVPGNIDAGPRHD